MTGARIAATAHPPKSISIRAAKARVRREREKKEWRIISEWTSPQTKSALREFFQEYRPTPDALAQALQVFRSMPRLHRRKLVPKDRKKVQAFADCVHRLGKLTDSRLVSDEARDAILLLQQEARVASEKFEKIPAEKLQRGREADTVTRDVSRQAARAYFLLTRECPTSSETKNNGFISFVERTFEIVGINTENSANTANSANAAKTPSATNAARNAAKWFASLSPEKR